LELLRRIRDGEHTAIQPYTVLIEVVAAIRRRTGSEELAARVARNLQSLDSFRFVELDSERAMQGMDLAAKLSLRGMDAIVVQVAGEFETTFVSLDEELNNRARGAIVVREVQELV